MCDFLKKYAILEDIEIDREGYLEWLKIREEERVEIENNLRFFTNQIMDEERARSKKNK